MLLDTEPRATFEPSKQTCMLPALLKPLACLGIFLSGAQVLQIDMRHLERSSQQPNLDGLFGSSASMGLSNRTASPLTSDLRHSSFSRSSHTQQPTQHHPQKEWHWWPANCSRMTDRRMCQTQNGTCRLMLPNSSRLIDRRQPRSR